MAKFHIGYEVRDHVFISRETAKETAEAAVKITLKNGGYSHRVDKDCGTFRFDFDREVEDTIKPVILDEHFNKVEEGL